MSNPENGGRKLRSARLRSSGLKVVASASRATPPAEAEDDLSAALSSLLGDETLWRDEGVPEAEEAAPHNPVAMSELGALDDILGLDVTSESLAPLAEVEPNELDDLLEILAEEEPVQPAQLDRQPNPDPPMTLDSPLPRSPVQSQPLVTAPISAPPERPEPVERRHSEERPSARAAKPQVSDLDRVLGMGAARRSTRQVWIVRAFWALLLAGAVYVAFLPYAYDVGGDFTIQPLARAEARSRTDGEIVEVRVREGDTVAQNQILAVLSNWDEKRDVALTEADGARLEADLATMVDGARPEEIRVVAERLSSAELSLTVAEAELARSETLFASGTISEKVVLDARAQVSLALSDREEARAQLDLVTSGTRSTEIDAQRAALARNSEELAFARLMLENTNIRAPAAGQIVSSLVEVPVGAYLAQGALFAEIEDNSLVIATVEVPETLIAEVVLGAEAELRLWSAPDQPLYGAVKSVAPRAEARDFGNIIRVDVEMPNPDGRLAANMTGFGKVAAAERPVWKAFSGALYRFVIIELWSWVP